MQTPQHIDQMDADDVAAIDELGDVYDQLKTALAKIIIGQEQVIEHLSICLFSQGHALLMGVSKNTLGKKICRNHGTGFQPNSIYT